MSPWRLRNKDVENHHKRRTIIYAEGEKQAIKKLQVEMDYMKNKSKPSKKTLQEIMKWLGEEINFSESINTFVREFLLPRYKFLPWNWMNLQMDCKVSQKPFRRTED